jgi:hypothetical protein
MGKDYTYAWSVSCFSHEFLGIQEFGVLLALRYSQCDCHVEILQGLSENLGVYTFSFMSDEEDITSDVLRCGMLSKPPP